MRLQLAKKAVSVLRGQRACIGAAATVVGLSVIPVAHGQTVANWVGTTGQYVNGANWDTATAPSIAGDVIAQINNAGTAQIAGADAAEAGILHLGLQNGNIGHLEISGGTLNVGEIRDGG